MKFIQGRGRVGHTFFAKVYNLSVGSNTDKSNRQKLDKDILHERKSNEYIGEETIEFSNVILHPRVGEEMKL